MEKIQWPQGRKCAVMLTFDLDGDTTWANGNRDYPGEEHFIKSTSIGQYGPKRSADMLLEVLGRYQVPATFFVPGQVAERNPLVIEKIAAAGHEIGHHGYTHERFFDKTPQEQIEIFQKSQEIYTKILGKPVTGFRTPSGDWSVETPSILHQLGFSYSSSMRGDDRPYRTVIDGKETDLIEIPTRWELDDYVEMAYNFFPAEPCGQDRISGYSCVLDNFTREFDGYRRYGLCCVFMMHPQVTGTPGKIQILEKLLAHMTAKGDVWFATGEQVAQWWRKTYPIALNTTKEGK